MEQEKTKARKINMLDMKLEWNKCVRMEQEKWSEWTNYMINIFTFSKHISNVFLIRIMSKGNLSRRGTLRHNIHQNKNQKHNLKWLTILGELTLFHHTHSFWSYF